MKRKISPYTTYTINKQLTHQTTKTFSSSNPADNLAILKSISTSTQAALQNKPIPPTPKLPPSDAAIIQALADNWHKAFAAKLKLNTRISLPASSAAPALSKTLSSAAKTTPLKTRIHIPAQWISKQIIDNRFINYIKKNNWWRWNRVRQVWTEAVAGRLARNFLSETISGSPQDQLTYLLLKAGIPERRRQSIIRGLTADLVLQSANLQVTHKNAASRFTPTGYKLGQKHFTANGQNVAYYEFNSLVDRQFRFTLYYNSL